jgi:predicted ATP-dependent protease
VASVFEGEDCVRRLAEMSGGCVRHLMQFVRDACQSAAGRDAERVAAADVEDAIKRHQFDFERMIPLEHYRELANVARTKAVSNDETGRQMLYNLSVLEYNGDRRWNYVHPLVRRIGKFREALDAT